MIKFDLSGADFSLRAEKLEPCICRENLEVNMHSSQTETLNPKLFSRILLIVYCVGVDSGGPA